ncbi:MAG: InlB B-repeat-containing protein [Bacilli bacterium]
MMRKISIFSILFVLLAFVCVNFVKVNAEGYSGAMLPGASIRTAGEQGLKFSATFDAAYLNDERGFFVIYGEATQADLLAVINHATPVINGKEVKKATTTFSNTCATISVVLTGIPVNGYAQAITVIGYAHNATDGYTLVESQVTRSIAEVALNAAKAGDGASVSTVLTDIGANFFKYGFDKFGNYVVSNPLYEYDHENLRAEFIADWNSFTGTTFTTLVGLDFFTSAKEGLTDAIGSNKNLAPSNIYKFFNNPAMNAKWGWFLDYITSVDGTTHPSRQIVAIKGDGTNGTYTLYHADQLSYSIVNFFNFSYVVGGYTAINFPAAPEKYNTVSNYNNKIYADYASYDGYIYKNKTITVPAGPLKEHYTFQYFNDGEANVNAGATYTVTKAVRLTPQYTANPYTLRYYDGSTLIESLNDTYTVEQAKTLPTTYSKDGYIFEGWYDNPELNGSAIVSFPAGTSGNKTYYAKMTLGSPFTITFNLNGGHWGYATRQDMVDDFLEDYRVFYNTATSSSLTAITLLVSGDPGYDAGTALVARLDNPSADLVDIFTDDTFYNKWIWIIQYTRGIRTSGQADFDALINKTATSSSSTVKYELWAFLAGRVRTSWPASSDYTIPANANGFWAAHFQQTSITYNTPQSSLPPLYKDNNIFDGWYTDATCMSPVVYPISANATLHAGFTPN